MTWNDYLKNYASATGELFDGPFLDRWGQQKWEPTDHDRKAAARLHIQIVSRITTQRLGYLDGVEKTALDSVYALFERTRTISDEQPDARLFQTVAWHVLNTHVRPFTAKWHRESERGALTALDTTDEFRAELTVLQGKLCRFEDLLRDLRDSAAQPSADRQIAGETNERQRIADEMAKERRWGIPRRMGGINPEIAEAINTYERKAIEGRRKYYQLADTPYAAGLALSGGGIRSATFSLGVLVALSRRGILPQFDYLSTVSGGGYLGSFLTTFLDSSHVTSPNAQKQNAATIGAAPVPSVVVQTVTTTAAATEEQPKCSSIGLNPAEFPFCREEGEAEALRHIRHRSKYLASGSPWEQVKMLCAQLYGLCLNVASIMFLTAWVVLFERYFRQEQLLAGYWLPVTTRFCILLATAAVIAPVLMRFRLQKHADTILAALALPLLLLLAWRGLEYGHQWIHSIWTIPHKWRPWDQKLLLSVITSIPIVASVCTRLFGSRFKRTGAVFVIVFAIAAPFCLLGMYFLLYEWAGGPSVAFGNGPLEQTAALWGLAMGLLIYFWVLNINFTSPHRHYRNKLAEAYLIQPESGVAPNGPFQNAVSQRLSKLGAALVRGPYHLLNAALNVPSSTDPNMQGRLTDFFLFSPGYCGSPLTGYSETKEWEEADPHLDLGTAMAISGAAAAPQMGLGTKKHLRFWLALLNIRLGYWVRNPKKKARRYGGVPGLSFLLREMLGWMNEKTPWLNVSDGGHIENLGVYELLRRRCKYIVAVDGEQDPKMTFAALTTLQRLAQIDLGIKIDINLDDLRLNDKGFSRSHFRFCRIKYPDETYGYLLYLKLSLTGNEGEFLRRYRLDEPAFPHHPTADQFFTEAQFEAYRSLGEHVGDKLFLRAIVGSLADSNSVEVEKWFHQLGKNLLAPR